ncbi:hypothetical protein CC86DRAFT_152733 [Ophiobolus disseminans]|uniref:Ubiquitin-like protease family profile domain-containing protein n=1 Tax=Ophiobolus disseminans TaxID=1469910 RepID=A0A6A6ZCU5_9PLEO|nr:hypothetical protein CC86DRAFT_152733 [Ophiobolus disseminans]
MEYVNVPGNTPYKAITELSIHAQENVVYLHSIFSRGKVHFHRLELSEWQLSLEQLIATFGCPSLMSREFVKVLAQLAEHAASVSWLHAWAALKAAQRDRKKPALAFKRGIIIAREWVPNDVNVAMNTLKIHRAVASTSKGGDDEHNEHEDPSDSVGSGQEASSERKRSHSELSAYEEIELPRRQRSRRSTVDSYSDHPATLGEAPSDDYASSVCSGNEDNEDNVDNEAHLFASSQLGDNHAYPPNSIHGDSPTREAPTDHTTHLATAAQLATEVQGHITLAQRNPINANGNATPKSNTSATPRSNSPRKHPERLLEELEQAVYTKKNTQAYVPVPAERAISAEGHAFNRSTFTGSTSVDCTKEQLEGTRDDGWLSHSDFSTVLTPTLPTSFSYLEVPDHSPSFDWTVWAAGKRTRSRDLRGIMFCVILDVARKHWVMLAIDFEKRAVSEYDSMYNASMTMEIPSRYITLRQGVQWTEGGWSYVRAHTPQQTDTRSCGVYALACIFCIMTGTAIPATLDPRLWRQAFVALVAATNEPLLPHTVADHLLEQPTVAALVSKQIKLVSSLRAWMLNIDKLLTVFARLDPALRKTTVELSPGKIQQVLQQLEHILPGAGDLCATERPCTCANGVNLDNGPLAKAHSGYIAEYRAIRTKVERQRLRITAIDTAIERMGKLTMAYNEARTTERVRLDRIASDLHSAQAMLSSFPVKCVE